MPYPPFVKHLVHSRQPLDEYTTRPSLIHCSIVGAESNESDIRDAQGTASIVYHNFAPGLRLKRVAAIVIGQVRGAGELSIGLG